MSRPPIEIPEDQILKLIERGHSMRSCANFFRVSPNTIKAHFEHLFTQWGGGQLAKTKTLDLMWAQAARGNTFALKYLAKEFLGYQETTVVDLTAYSEKIKELPVEELRKLANEKFEALEASKDE